MNNERNGSLLHRIICWMVFVTHFHIKSWLSHVATNRLQLGYFESVSSFWWSKTPPTEHAVTLNDQFDLNWGLLFCRAKDFFYVSPLIRVNVRLVFFFFFFWYVYLYVDFVFSSKSIKSNKFVGVVCYCCTVTVATIRSWRWLWLFGWFFFFHFFSTFFFCFVLFWKVASFYSFVFGQAKMWSQPLTIWIRSSCDS